MLRYGAIRHSKLLSLSKRAYAIQGPVKNSLKTNKNKPHLPNITKSETRFRPAIEAHGRHEWLDLVCSLGKRVRSVALASVQRVLEYPLIPAT